MKSNTYKQFKRKISLEIKKYLRDLRKQDRQAGSSLIEILVAVSIVVILASAIGIAVFQNIEKAQIAMVKQHISTLKDRKSVV